jgi:hypothetical protein
VSTRARDGSTRKAALVLQLLNEMSKATMAELRQTLGARGHLFGYRTLRTFPQAAADHKKDNVHAAEQNRPDALTRRCNWFEAQPDLEPSRLIFIDM